MFSAKHLFVAELLLAISLNISYFEAVGDDPSGGVNQPQNVSKCDTPCQSLTPPAGYPAYVAPPPPSPPPPSPPPSGYAIYSAPPPPHKSKCPPAQGATTPPYGTYYGPPTAYYGPPTAYYGPPSPYYTFSPPNFYTPVPYGQGTRSASLILPVLAPVMMLFSSLIFVF